MSAKLKSTTTSGGGDDDNNNNYMRVEVTPTCTLRILEDLSEDDDEADTEDAVGRFVWPTAVPLLRHILAENSENGNNNSPRVIVELGSGCGVLGMGLAATTIAAETMEQGHRTSSNCEVILTDHDSEWLKRNLALNQAMLGEVSRVSVARLDWRIPQDLETVQTLIQEKLSTMSNNHNSDNDTKNDVELMIVGSDILYNHQSHRSLASTMHQLSQIQPKTRIIVGFPDRDHDEENFLPLAREFFGETFPSSKPLHYKETNKRGKTMDLRALDFTTTSHNLSP